MKKYPEIVVMAGIAHRSNDAQGREAPASKGWASCSSLPTAPWPSSHSTHVGPFISLLVIDPGGCEENMQFEHSLAQPWNGA